MTDDPTANRPTNPSAVVLARAIRAGRSNEELKAIADREAEHYRDAPRDDDER